MKKIGFVTCVQLGLSCMEEIYQMGGSLDLLITLSDEKGRNKSGRIYPDEFAHRHGIPLMKVDNINQAEVECAIRDKELDWLLIIGWSQIAGAAILHAPKEGCIGMHPTLLPEGRGRAAIPWAILKGLDETGVTMFRLDEGVDTGAILGQERIPLSSEISATQLYRMVNRTHIRLIRKYWRVMVEGTIVLKPQDESRASVWRERRPEDGRITGTMTVREALTMVRAVTRPYPGAYWEEGGKKLRIWSAKAFSERGEENSGTGTANRAETTGSAKQEPPCRTLRLKDGSIQLVDYEAEDE